MALMGSFIALMSSSCRVGRSSWLFMGRSLMSSFLQGGEVFMALMSSYLKCG